MRGFFPARHLIALLCFFAASGCAATGTATRPGAASPPPTATEVASTEAAARSATVGPTPKPVVLFVVSARVNLRECASTQCKVAAVLEQGDEVIRLGQDEGWINVRVKATGREGWIASQLLGKTPKRKISSGIKGQSLPPAKDKPGPSELQEEFAP